MFAEWYVEYSIRRRILHADILQQIYHYNFKKVFERIFINICSCETYEVLEVVRHSLIFEPNIVLYSLTNHCFIDTLAFMRGELCTTCFASNSPYFDSTKDIINNVTLKRNIYYFITIRR